MTSCVRSMVGLGLGFATHFWYKHQAKETLHEKFPRHSPELIKEMEILPQNLLVHALAMGILSGLIQKGSIDVCNSIASVLGEMVPIVKPTYQIISIIASEYFTGKILCYIAGEAQELNKNLDSGRLKNLLRRSAYLFKGMGMFAPPLSGCLRVVHFAWLKEQDFFFSRQSMNGSMVGIFVTTGVFGIATTFLLDSGTEGLGMALASGMISLISPKFFAYPILLLSINEIWKGVKEEFFRVKEAGLAEDQVVG